MARKTSKAKREARPDGATVEIKETTTKKVTVRDGEARPIKEVTVVEEKTTTVKKVATPTAAAPADPPAARPKAVRKTAKTKLVSSRSTRAYQDDPKLSRPRRILRLLAAKGKLGPDEIVAALPGLTRVQVGEECQELVDEGLLKKSGTAEAPVFEAVDDAPST